MTCIKKSVYARIRTPTNLNWYKVDVCAYGVVLFAFLV